jgi:DNA-binding transcriptional LysR family regulator
VQQTNDLATMVAAVRAGLGLAVLSHLMAGRDPSLVEVPTSEPP